MKKSWIMVIAVIFILLGIGISAYAILNPDVPVCAPCPPGRTCPPCPPPQTPEGIYAGLALIVVGMLSLVILAMRRTNISSSTTAMS